jgi:CheY-like chemotaxis protein
MKTVLIIEDDELGREFLRCSLEAEGYQVLEAANGDDGITMFNANPQIDLIVTDIAMPLKNGIDVIVEILGLNSKTKIIAITGMCPLSRQNFLNTASLMGVSAMLMKPFSRETFIETINKVLKK